MHGEDENLKIVLTKRLPHLCSNILELRMINKHDIKSLRTGINYAGIKREREVREQFVRWNRET